MLLHIEACTLYAQHKDTVSIYCRKGSSRLESNYRGNGEKLRELARKINRYQEDSLFFIQRIDLFSKSSPEGSVSLNEALAYGRSKAIADYLGQSVGFVDSVVFVTCLDEDWDHLYRMVQMSHDIPDKKEVLDIFENTPPDDSREKILKQLSDGRPWNYMASNFFPSMRSIDVVVTLGVLEPIPDSQLQSIISDNIQPVEESLHFKLSPLRVETKPLPQDYRANWYLKTNVVALGMLVANISGEVDLGERLSIAVPFYYSSWDYFSSDIKFKTIMLQPELKYWLAENRRGLYGGVHAGVAWYNIAAGGNWRIQDKDAKSPAIGGGISIGYRMHLHKANPRWMIEFGLGAGAYAVEYDKFHNTEDGTLYMTKKKTYVGPDQVSINLIYQMNGKRRASK